MPFVVEHGHQLWPVALAVCVIAGPLLASRWRRLAGRRGRVVAVGVAGGLVVWSVIFVAVPVTALSLVAELDAKLGIASDPESALGVATPWPGDWRLAMAPLAAMGPFSRPTYLRERTWTLRAPSDPAEARAIGDRLGELGGRCDLNVRHAAADGDEERALALAQSCDDVRARRIAAAIHFAHGELRAASAELARVRREDNVVDEPVPPSLFAARVHLAAGQPRRAIEALDGGVIAGAAREVADCVSASLRARTGDAAAARKLRAAAQRSAACALLAAEPAVGAERDRLLRATSRSPFEYAAWLLRLDGGAVPTGDDRELRIRGTFPLLLDAFTAARGIPALEARALARLERAGDAAAARAARARLETELAVAAVSSGRDSDARRFADRAISELAPAAASASDPAARTRYERAVALAAAIRARTGNPDAAMSTLASLPADSAARGVTAESIAWLGVGTRPGPWTARRSWVGARESTLWYVARIATSDAAFGQKTRRVCPPRRLAPLRHARCPATDELREDWAGRGAGTRCRTCALARLVTDYTFRVDLARRVGVEADRARFAVERDRLRTAWLDPRFALAVVVLEAADRAAADPEVPGAVQPRVGGAERDADDPWDCPDEGDCRR